MLAVYALTYLLFSAFWFNVAALNQPTNGLQPSPLRADILMIMRGSGWLWFGVGAFWALLAILNALPYVTISV